MRSLLAVLVLVAAAAAEETPVVHEGSVKVDAINVPIVIDEMRLVSLYGLPKTQSEFGIRDIFNRPMFLSFKMEGKNDVSVYLLKEGLKSIYMDPKFDILRKFILSGPEKVAMMLSAAHALDLPEMRFNIHDITLGSDSTPVSALRLFSEPTFPFVFLTAKTELPATSLERLFELGQFQVYKDRVMILKDLLPVEEVVRPVTTVPYMRYLREPVATIIESPIFESEEPILNRGRVGAAYRPHEHELHAHAVTSEGRLGLERLERIEQPFYRHPYPYRTMFSRYPSSLVHYE